MQTKLLEIEYFFIFFFFTFLPQNNQQQRYSKKGNKEEEEKQKKNEKSIPQDSNQNIVLIRSTKVRNKRLCACICVHVYVNVYVKPEVGSNWLVKRQNMQTEISTRE